MARGHLRIDEARYTGKIDGEDIDRVPDSHRQGRHRARPGTLQHLLHAVPRPHRATATAWWCCAVIRQAASFYQRQRLMKAPVGHFFDVITNGFGAMPSYASRVEPDDRWRMIALHPRPAVERIGHAQRRARRISARICPSSRRAARARVHGAPSAPPARHRSQPMTPSETLRPQMDRVAAQCPDRGRGRAGSQLDRTVHRRHAFLAILSVRLYFLVPA